MSRYDIVCVHTIVGFAPAHAAHFSTYADGRIHQSRDTKYQSGANLEGNPRIIAIENEDHGSAYGAWDTDDGHDVPAFTQAQIEAIARICAWAHQTHGVPLEPCPDSKPGSRGIAYHRQGIDGNFADYDYPGRVPGGEVWTESPGKVCPGDRRIEQVLEQIIDRAKAIVRGEDPDMTVGYLSMRIDAPLPVPADGVWHPIAWQVESTDSLNVHGEGSSTMVIDGWYALELEASIEGAGRLAVRWAGLDRSTNELESEGQENTYDLDGGEVTSFRDAAVGKVGSDRKLRIDVKALDFDQTLSAASVGGFFLR